MTPARFRECLLVLDLSRHALADRLGISDKLCRSWYSGSITVPPEIEAWLEACVEIEQNHPMPAPPKVWTTLPRRTNPKE